MLLGKLRQWPHGLPASLQRCGRNHVLKKSLGQCSDEDHLTHSSTLSYARAYFHSTLVLPTPYHAHSILEMASSLNRRKSAHFDTKRAHNVQNKHKNKALMFYAPCRATLVLFMDSASHARALHSKSLQNLRAFRRKIARVFGANRTARSQKVLETMHAVCMKLQSFMRMYCDLCACLARRSRAKIDAKPRACRRKRSKKICALRHGTRAQRATQAQKQCIDVLCAMQSHAGDFAWTRQAMRATLGSKTLQNFAEIREIFAGKSCAFSARIAPHDHRKCQKPCMQSA